MKTKEQVLEDIKTLRSRFEDGKFLYNAPHEVVVEAMELYIILLQRLINIDYAT